MHFDINAVALNNQEKPIRLNVLPDNCPQCHNNVFPKYNKSFYINSNQELMIQASFQCVNVKCQSIFIGYYTKSGNEGNREVFDLVRVAPIAVLKEDFSEIINDVSPSFVEIYNQAIAAESANLTQIIGIGLRKAIEFLIKDFAIKENPKDIDKIKTTFLGQCIENYIEDSNIRECAKRATWIGNDETHYIRRWEDKDVNDLKLLIRLTVNWVENVVLTKKYIQEMDKKDS